MNFSLKDLIKENLKLFEGRREDAQAKYTDVPERIFNIFVEEEPSGNYKYLDWIMKIWQQEMCGYSSSYRCGNVSVAKNMMNNISYFNENPHKYEIKDINGFTSFANFTNSTNDAKLKLTKGELKKQATKHYETGRYLIVEPHSHPSSKFLTHFLVFSLWASCIASLASIGIPLKLLPILSVSVNIWPP